MALQQTQNNISVNQTQNNGKTDYAQIKELYYTCLHKWYWFVFSLLATMLIAYLYIAKTMPKYTRTAQVEIKDDKAGKSIGNRASGITDIGLFNTTSTVDNEKYVFQSPDLMYEVVDRLKLQYNYVAKGRLRTVVLYGENLPIEVKILDAKPEDYIAFTMDINGDVFTLSKLRKNKDEYDATVKGQFGKTCRTAVGNINVTLLKPIKGKQTIYVTRSKKSRTTNGYMARVGVSIADKLAEIITLTITDESAQRAEDVLNKLIEVYNERWVQDKNQVTVATTKFIRDRLKMLESDLSGVDQTISEFKSSNMLPDVEEAAKMYMEKGQESKDKVVELGSQLEMGKYMRNFVANSGKNTLIPSGSGLSSGAIEKQIDAYNDLILKRQSLIDNSSINNALLPGLDEQIKNLRAAITKSLDNQNVVLQTQIRNMEASTAEKLKEIQKNPQQAKTLLSVERQQAVKQSLYMFLLQKLEENELSQAFTAYNTRIVMLPYGSLLPTSPKKHQIYLIALLLGLLIPFGIIYLKRQLITTLQTRKELQDVVSAPFLGEIPEVANDDRKWRWPWQSKLTKSELVVVKHGQRDVVNEAFRVLRTNIEFVSAKADEKVMAITSYNVNSGKTFIAINLALTFALKKKKTLLIDCDLRKASSSKYINNPKQGLSDYLADQ
ncbi:MAG: GNVR domain-containing protein, partial [Prevotellaceae bacterium]|nr:GNVR domain-containing protein [Prevotellaceae bacterium]